MGSFPRFSVSIGGVAPPPARKQLRSHCRLLRPYSSDLELLARLTSSRGCLFAVLVCVVIHSLTDSQRLRLETALIMRNRGGWTTTEMVKQIKAEVQRRALGEMQA
jgi:hypothetical protein